MSNKKIEIPFAKLNLLTELAQLATQQLHLRTVRTGPTKRLNWGGESVYSYIQDLLN